MAKDKGAKAGKQPKADKEPKAGKEPKVGKQPKAPKEPKAPESPDLKKLRKLIKGARVAMLTTIASDGTLRSRPMATLKAPFEGDLWFFTRASAPKAEEIRDNDRVNVSFSAGNENRYLSISGTASIVRDMDRIEKLWSGKFKSWFPDGKKDPDLALLRVRLDRGEYWDKKSSAMVHLVGLVRSSLGGDPAVDNRKAEGTPPGGASTSGAGAQG